MFGPLHFRDIKSENVRNATETGCLVCEDVFNLKLCPDIYLKHLFEVHFIVIEDVQNIYNLDKYLKYWRVRIKDESIERIVPSVAIEGTDRKYFVFSDLLKDDRDFRARLRLERALDAQELERSESGFKKECLFCRFSHEGTRYEYMQHLSEKHNFQLGNPRNLVFIDELLVAIEEKLANLQCIYCEKIFGDRGVLKEHMRKKLHKRINPQNKTYDRFYVINYVGDSAVRSTHTEENRSPENTDEDYEDWREANVPINCLFCDEKNDDINRLCLHMHSSHGFNFGLEAVKLDFYQRVKLVNYVRKKIHSKQCPNCDYTGTIEDSLRGHMKTERHCRLPDIKKFDQPEYYFPTYENDAFLYFLEELED